jgi:hypothetical protein
MFGMTETESRIPDTGDRIRTGIPGDRHRYSVSGIPYPGVVAIAGLALLIGARPGFCQAAVAADLWRTAQGTLLVPASLSEDGAGPLWTPAIGLADGQRLRVGIEAIHAPSEIGVTGGVLAVTLHAPAIGIVNLTYGRLGVAGVGFTETSPEAAGPALAIYNQVASVGVSRHLGRTVTGGIALRYLTGRLATASRSQFGMDLGAQYQGRHLRLGASTRFFDPTFSSSRDAASYNAGAEYRTGTIDGWGAPMTLAIRYGITAAPDDGVAHLVSAGVALGGSLMLDGGVSREVTPSDKVWRSLLGLGIAAGRYVVRIGRDGGTNGFGATYRFGLTAVFK